MTSNKSFNLISWNVRGMVTLAKQKQVITRLKQLKSLIHETHLLREGLVIVRRRGYGVNSQFEAFPS